MIYLDDADFRLYQGDVLDCLAEIPTGSIHCVVTSPPYWGLRDYGAGAQEVGSEPTLMDYLEKMVAVFGEVRRVLRDDGTVWLNMGDCYVSDGAARAGNTTRPQVVDSKRNGNGDGTAVRPPAVAGLKQKDLVGVPWRLAFALQDDGWWLRMDNVWFKPNPMPESVLDRPTKAHEYVFLLTKSGTAQFWTNEMRPELSGTRDKPDPDYWWHPPPGASGQPQDFEVIGWKRRNAWRGFDYFYDKTAVEEEATYYGPNGGPQSMDGNVNSRAGEMKSRAGGGRTRRKPLIPEQTVAGASEGGCCPECRAPYSRIVERDWFVHHTMVRSQTAKKDNGDDGDRGFVGTGEQEVGAYTTETIGFRPTCACLLQKGNWVLDVERPDSIPCTVLDIFMGSGTTAFVARRMGRHAIGIELNPEYCELIASRTQQLGLGL